VARFPHREGAGREIGHRLRLLRLPDPVVVAASDGGVPVAAAVARVLGAPLDAAGAPGRTSGSSVAVAGRPAVVVDDGVLAAEAPAAIAAEIADRGAARRILAVPVATALELDALYACFDEILCLEVAGVRTDLALWYDELPDVTDTAVDDAVAGARAARGHVARHRAAAAPWHPATRRVLRHWSA
jgi:predicted phosphoribosyltransferase